MGEVDAETKGRKDNRRLNNEGMGGLLCSCELFFRYEAVSLAGVVFIVVVVVGAVDSEGSVGPVSAVVETAGTAVDADGGGRL